MLHTQETALDKATVNLPESPRQLEQPDISDIIQSDRLSPLSPGWRRLQHADHNRWTKRYLLPAIKVTCLLVSWITLLFKRLIPLPIGSERLLNWLSQLFMKYVVSPEAQEMLYRHFSVENALVHFAIQNSGAKDIQLVTLRPNSPEQLGNVAGTNATLMHDRIILNLFADLGKSQDADTTSRRRLSDMDFSALQLPEFKIYSNNPGRLLNLDFESSLYITVMVIALCFTYKQLENAVGSLFLDRSLMQYLTNLTGINNFRFWALSALGEHPHVPLDPADYLHRHILIHEYAYYQLQQLQTQQQPVSKQR